MADITHGTWIKDGKAVDAVYQNGVKVYGRNLALRTATSFTINGSGSNYMYHLSRTIVKGTTVTVSYDIESTASTGNFTTQFVGGSYEGSSWYPIVSGAKHYSYTLVTGNDYLNGIQIRLDNSTSTVTVSNLVISESQKEVSWTPAPEDVM